MRTQLDDGKVHLASECTMYALAPHIQHGHGAVPLLGVPTCKAKHDNEGKTQAERQRDTLSMILKRLKEKKTPVKVMSIVSDGDASRRLAFHSLTNTHVLQSTSRLHPSLATCALLCLKCGIDEITSRYDDKHNVKRGRLVVKSPTRGFTVYQTKFTGNTLVSLCAKLNIPFEKELLTPRDAQNVKHAVRLVKVLRTIGDAPTAGLNLTPADLQSLKEIRLYALLTDGILAPLFDAELSLSGQLVLASELAHALCFLHLQVGTKCPTSYTTTSRPMSRTCSLLSLSSRRTGQTCRFGYFFWVIVLRLCSGWCVLVHTIGEWMLCSLQKDCWDCAYRHHTRQTYIMAPELRAPCFGPSGGSHELRYMGGCTHRPASWA